MKIQSKYLQTYGKNHKWRNKTFETFPADRIFSVAYPYTNKESHLTKRVRGEIPDCLRRKSVGGPSFLTAKIEVRTEW